MRTTHRYQLAGTYNVVLTVTDDRGVRASTAPTPIVVTTAADPVASFTLSPSDPVVGPARDREWQRVEGRARPKHRDDGLGFRRWFRGSHRD